MAELLEVAGQAVVQTDRQAVEGGLIFGFEGAVEGDGFLAMLGNQRAAAIFAAGRAHDQRLIGQIVHGVDRVPRRLVGKWHGLGRLGNRAVFFNGFEQANAGIAEKTAELGIDFQLTAQTVCDLFHFVAFATLCCYVYNDNLNAAVDVEKWRFFLLRYGLLSGTVLAILTTSSGNFVML